MTERSPQPNSSDTTAQEHWEDVTQVFQRAREEMEVGEMIHLDNFNLHAAMSAIELMDPKMDIGVGKVRDASEVRLPSELSDAQVINIMDQLVICELSWLDGHTLPQTVFSCVYSQRMYDIPRFELFSFLRVQIATMDSILNLILDEKVADDEDFIASTYGFNLRPLSSELGGDEPVLRKILQKLETENTTRKNTKNSLFNALELRMRLQIELYRLIQCLSGISAIHTLQDAPELLSRLKLLSSQWINCPLRHDVDKEMISHLFDPSINRHLMTSSPPRTAPLFDFAAASSYLQRMLSELTELVELEDTLLPWRNRKLAHSLRRRCSLQVSMHGAAYFGSQVKPTVLTRSLMSRIMIPEYSTSLFANEDAEFVNLLGTDMGYNDQMMTTELISSLSSARDGMYDTFKCLCRNRSRQRRQLLRLMRWWDHYAFSVSETHEDDTESIGTAVTPDPTGQESQEDGKVETGNLETKANGSGENATVDHQGDRGALDEVFMEKTPLQLLSYEVSARLMIHHWLLGFECDLYQEYEYGAVFFYVGYVLTLLSNATTSLANKSPAGAALHPLRFALYTMDEARLWMCRAMHSVLEALSRGPQWAFSSGRDHKCASSGLPMFGSEELWYEQRFGVVRGMVNGPEYADYTAYLSFKKVHEESLVSRGNGSGMMCLLLKDAASSFLTARRTLERAKKAAQVCSSNKISTEVVEIARVAVANSLALSELLKQTSASPDDEEINDCIYNVNFSFHRHRHFPVIQIKLA